jgi:malonyl-CoA O-methyltransferase
MEKARFLLQEVQGRMAERLDLIRLQPRAVLDLGCGDGLGVESLRARYPQAQLHAVDQAPAMIAKARARFAPVSALHKAARSVSAALGMRKAVSDVLPICIVGDAAELPLADDSVDLVWSNLAFHWFADPVRAIAQCKRVLRADGLLMMSSFGVDTALELQSHGAALPTFQDMHDIGDALVNAGFADPVVDMEKITFTYENAECLLRDVRALGGNALLSRSKGLHTPRQREQWLKALEQTRSLTVEVVYVHAWLPAKSKLPDGYAPIVFSPRRD